MSRLRLWNFDLELTPGNPRTLSNANDSIRFELKNASQLELAVKSTANQWKIDLGILLNVQIQPNDNILLTGIATSTITRFSWLSAAQVTFKAVVTDGVLNFIPSQEISEPMTLLAADPISNLGGHLDAYGVDAFGLKQIPALGFDYEDGLVVLFQLKIDETASNLFVRDDFFDEDDESIFKKNVDQKLVPINIGVCERDQRKIYQMNFRPASRGNFLYVNPYIFHTSGVKDNLLAYQYCLVNGVLRYDSRLDTWSWCNGSVLLLNYTDPNGNPVALKKDVVKLERRRGSTNIDNARAGDNFEMLSRGMTISSGNELFFVDSIAPRSVNNNFKNKQLYAPRNDNEGADALQVNGTPYWLASDGTVKLTGKAPFEFYGQAKGTIYRPNNGTLLAKVVVENVYGVDNDVIYHAMSLVFTAQELDVMTLMEEKESSALNQDPAKGKIALRTFSSNIAADAGQIEHKLPASNYKIAAANIVPAAGPPANIPSIPKEVGDWINRLQSTVTLMSAGNDNLKHESGFIRMEAEPVNPRQFFSQAPQITNLLADTAPTNVELVRVITPAGFVHGSKSANDNPFKALKKNSYAMNNVAADVQVEVNPEDILRGLRRARRFWNESASAVEDEARFWKAVKFYLQKGPDQLLVILDQPHVDFNKLNDIRVEFDEFLGNNKASKVLGDLRQVVSGNLNAINGLGSQLRLIADEVNTLTEDKLRQIWNTEWSLLQESERKISELLNYYYYSFDRKVITDMSKFLSLMKEPKSDVEKALKKAFESIGLDINKALLDIEHLIKQEVADLEQSVEIEVKRLLSEVWIDVDSYVAELEKIWNIVIPSEREVNNIKDRITAIALDPVIIEWQVARGKLEVATNLNDVFGAIASEGEILWKIHKNNRPVLAAELLTLYTQNFLEEIRKIKVKFGAYFNPLAYKKILDELKNGVTDELKFLKETLRRKVIDKFESELLSTLKSDIASFEEDILYFGRQAKVWKEEFTQGQHQVLDLLALDISSTDDLVRTRLKSLLTHTRGFDAFCAIVADFKGITLKPEVQKIDEFVSQNRKKFNEVLTLIKDISKSTTLDVVFNEIKGIATDFKKIADIIKNPDVALDLVKKYLIHKYDLNIRLEDLRLQPPEYAVYGKNVAYNVEPSIVNKYNSIVERLFGSKFTLASFDPKKKWNMIQGESSVYIIKLGNNLTIADIIEDIEKNNAKVAGASPFGWTPEEKIQYIKEIPTELGTKFWRGVFIIKPLADISKDSDLSTLLGLSHFRMTYAAIGGEATSIDLAEDLNVYARIKDEKNSQDKPEEGETEIETEYTVTSFDATIRNTRLVAGEITSLLTIRSLMGCKLDEAVKVIITGSLPPKNDLGDSGGGFEFAARLETPIHLKMNFAFFKEVIISKIRAAKQKDKCYLEIDASVSFQEFATQVGGLDNVSLKNFRIEVPAQARGASVKLGEARQLLFDMQAIEFMLSKPRPLTLIGMELLPTGLGFTRSYDGSFSKYLKVLGKEPDEKKKFAYVKLDVEFGNLTSLGNTDGQSLKMSGLLGFQLEGEGNHKLFFGISGGEFENIDINLFRFIELKISKLAILNHVVAFDGNHEHASVIYTKEAVLRLLNWPVFGENGKLSVLLLNEESPANEPNPKNRKGFYFFYHNAEPDPKNVIRIYWVLISKGIVFPNDDVLTRLLTLNGEAHDPLDLPPSSGIEENPSTNFNQLAFANDNNWLLGASFGIGEIFERCTFILHDKHYYGIMLMSQQAWFKTLFGGEKIVLAYMPGRTKKEDRFRTEMPLPFLNFFGSLKTGMFALEIGMNKDVLFDLGYPWRVGNRYEWPRAFSSIQGITEIKFGVYFEKRTEYLPEGDGKFLTIGAGIGLYYGYYVGGRTPIAWAEAGVGLFVILAGHATFRMNGGSALDLVSASLVRMEVVGVIGIYAYAQGGVDYWVISATFRVEIQAAIAGHLIYLPHGGSSLSYDATLSARFSASARVKLGFVKVTVRVSGSVDLRVAGRLALN